MNQVVLQPNPPSSLQSLYQPISTLNLGAKQNRPANQQQQHPSNQMTAKQIQQHPSTSQTLIQSTATPGLKPSDIVKLKKTMGSATSTTIPGSLSARPPASPSSFSSSSLSGVSSLAWAVAGSSPVCAPTTAIPTLQTEIVLPYCSNFEIQSNKLLNNSKTKMGGPSLPVSALSPAIVISKESQLQLGSSHETRHQLGSSPEGSNSGTFNIFPSETPFGAIEAKGPDPWFGNLSQQPSIQPIQRTNQPYQLTNQGPHPAPPHFIPDLGKIMSPSFHSLPHALDSPARPASAASSCTSNQSEEEMIALIDQMTNHMFDADQVAATERRSTSLPRIPRPGSGAGSPSPRNSGGTVRFQSLNRKDRKPSAYERLFGKDGPSMKDFRTANNPDSPNRRKFPVFIPKAGTAGGRRREKSGGDKPSIHNTVIRNVESPVSDKCPDYVRASQYSKRVDTSSIDKMLGVPDKIDIPQRYVPEKAGVYNFHFDPPSLCEGRY